MHQARDRAAAEQGARWLELRATTSLARIACATRICDEARAILDPIDSVFTEGFDTADLKNARALLEELA